MSLGFGVAAGRADEALALAATMRAASEPTTKHRTSDRRL
jgi:hypothetical protein